MRSSILESMKREKLTFKERVEKYLCFIFPHWVGRRIAMRESKRMYNMMVDNIKLK